MTYRIYIVFIVQIMFSQSHKVLLLVSIAFLLILWRLLWIEHVADDFWAMGLPIQVGGLTIRTWATFWIFIVGMSVLTILRAIIKHTAERDVIRVRAEKWEARMTWDMLWWWVVWDVYEKLVDVSTILIAVLRFDIWLILFVVHMVTVVILHALKIHQGRMDRPIDT